MNSAMKPVLAPQGVQGPAPAIPAKGPLVGQNLTAQSAPAAVPAPTVPSMAPITPNMAQMAHNMSHHGNLSLQNNAVPAVNPNKTPGAPLSLVADKPQPLALTCATDKEPDSTGQSNGTVEQLQPAANAPATFKLQTNEPSTDKQDIAKTSPSTPKPPENPNAPKTNTPNTPQKAEQANTTQGDGLSQPMVATANEAPEKSPAKPSEPKPAPTADVAPTQSNSKPLPESANDNKVQEKPAAPANPTAPTGNTAATASSLAATPNTNAQAAKSDSLNATENAKSVTAPTDNKEETKAQAAETLAPKDVVEVKEVAKPEPIVKESTPAQNVVKQESPKIEAPVKAPTPQKETPKPEVIPKKPEKTAAEKKQEPKVTPKSTLKLATLTPAMRKRRQPSPKPSETSPAKKPAEGGVTPDSQGKRNRTKVQLYQSPTPELTMATKLSASAGRSTPAKPGDDKLIVFYKNEYLAVRNTEGGFFVCQTVQNVYRTTRKIKIRWLSQDMQLDPKGETYKPDFYDTTDMETVLTTLSLKRSPSGGGAWVLKPAEQARAANILQRAIRAEQGQRDALVSPEHPDGLDLSLFTDESQLEKRSPRKRAAAAAAAADSTSDDDDEDDSEDEPSPPAKKARGTPKRTPKSAAKAKASPKQNKKNKRKPAGSTPNVASTSKTATALREKVKTKSSPVSAAPKRTPVKKDAKPAPTPSPVRQGRRAANKEVKPPPAPVPSTSTGKATRTPRKPPANK